MQETEKKYPEGHFIGIWIGICIAVFTGFGVILSIASNTPGLIGIGPAIGVSIGVAIGVSIESKHKKQGRIRPLNEVEKKKRKRALITLIGIFAIGVIAFALLYITLF